MNGGGEPQRATRLDVALAGFEAGMVATLAMLVWLALAAKWYRHTIWTAANIMASNFYGDNAIGPGFAWSSLSGVAVYLILYSLFGALFALAVRGGMSRLRLVLAGILAGVAWYYLWFGLLWPRIDPLVTLYTHDQPMMWGHMLFGGMLGRFPVYLRRLAGLPGRPVPLPMPQAGREAAAELAEPAPGTAEAEHPDAPPAEPVPEIPKRTLE